MTRLPHASRVLVVPALVAVLAATLTACGDDAEPAPAPTTGPASEPTSEAPTTSAAPAPTDPPSETATEEPGPTTDPTPTAEPGEPSDPPVEPSPTGAPEPVGPTTYADAQARVDAAGQEPQRLERFRTASGTYCLLGYGGLVGCELDAGQGTVDPGLCGGDGPSERVGRVLYTGTGAAARPTPECNSDTVREPGARQVADGGVASSSGSGLQCLVESIGVTCIAPAQRNGFFLGPGQYAVFPAR